MRWSFPLLILVGLSCLCFAADLYIADDGGGTDCSQQFPCGLATALSKAQSGDSIIASAGTYSLDPTGLVFSTSLNISSTGSKNDSFIDFQATTSNGITVTGTGVAVMVAGFSLQNFQTSDDSVFIFVDGGSLTITDAEVPSVAIGWTNVSSTGACLKARNGGTISLARTSFGPISGELTKPGTFIYAEGGSVVSLEAVDIPSVMVLGDTTDPSVVAVASRLLFSQGTIAVSMCNLYANVSCVVLSQESRLELRETVLSDVLLALHDSALHASQSSLLSTIFTAENSTIILTDSKLHTRSKPVLGLPVPAPSGALNILRSSRLALHQSHFTSQPITDYIGSLVFAEASDIQIDGNSTISHNNSTAGVFSLVDSTFAITNSSIRQNAVYHLLRIEGATSSAQFSRTRLNRNWAIGSFIAAHDGAQLTVSDCFFEGGDFNDSAFFLFNASIIVEHTTLLQINAIPIHAVISSVSAFSLRCTGNANPKDGGCMRLVDSHANVAASWVSYNQLSHSANPLQCGGAIALVGNSASARILDTELIGNLANNGGALCVESVADCSQAPRVWLHNSTVAKNPQQLNDTGNVIYYKNVSLPACLESGLNDSSNSFAVSTFASAWPSEIVFPSDTITVQTSPQTTTVSVYATIRDYFDNPLPYPLCASYPLCLLSLDPGLKFTAQPFTCINSSTIVGELVIEPNPMPGMYPVPVGNFIGDCIGPLDLPILTTLLTIDVVLAGPPTTPTAPSPAPIPQIPSVPTPVGPAPQSPAPPVSPGPIDLGPIEPYPVSKQTLVIIGLAVGIAVIAFTAILAYFFRKRALRQVERIPLIEPLN